jgi:hypothetical protein
MALSVAIISVIVLLTGCNAGLFKKPTQDMLDGVKTLRDVYFEQLRLRRQADAEVVVALSRETFWRHPELAKDSSHIAATRKYIVDAKGLALLPEPALAVRQRAFDALEAYAATLVALASDDDVDAVADELKGLASDVEGVVKQARTIGALASLAGKAEAWLGPLGNVVSAFTQIVRLVSNIERAIAIRQVVRTAHRPIKEILDLLREEAIYARNDTTNNYEKAAIGVNEILKAGIKSADAIPAAIEYSAALLATREALKRMPAVEDSFAAAMRAQDALHQKVGDPDMSDLVLQVRAFRDQVRATKAAFQAVR